MTEPTDAERAEFEAWAIAEYISVNRSLDGTDGYFEGDSQIAWAAWQAARRTPTPQPTQAQAGAVPLTAGWCTHCGEGVTNFCRSKCGDRVCPIGLPRIKGADHA